MKLKKVRFIFTITIALYLQNAKDETYLNINKFIRLLLN